MIKLTKRTTKVGLDVLNSVVGNRIKWWELSDLELEKANKCVHKSVYSDKWKRKIKDLEKLAKRYNYSNQKSDRLQIICANIKTGVSIDFMNSCFFECSYCYMNSINSKAQVGKHFWKVNPDFLTSEKEIAFRKFLEDFKKVTNNNYALRFFALADCPTGHINLLKKLLNICNEHGVKTIVISKNVNIFLHIINIASTTLMSVDIGKYNAPTTFEQYLELNQIMPKLRAFFMVVDFQELRQVVSWHIIHNLKNWQVVAYHGQLKPTKFNKYPPVKSTIKTTIKPEFLNILTNQIHKSVACTKCLNCSFLCGARDSYKRINNAFISARMDSV